MAELPVELVAGRSFGGMVDLEDAVERGGAKAVSRGLDGGGILRGLDQRRGAKHLGMAVERVLVARDADHAVRAEARVALRAHVVVVGDRHVVETPRSRDGELARDRVPDDVRLRRPVAVIQELHWVLLRAPRVMGVGRVDVQVPSEPLAGERRRRLPEQACSESEHGSTPRANPPPHVHPGGKIQVRRRF